MSYDSGILGDSVKVAIATFCKCKIFLFYVNYIGLYTIMHETRKYKFS
jgi:hypothetical protein